MNRTVPRIGSFAALLVELGDEQAKECTSVLETAGLEVTRAGHLAAALARIPVLQPYVVVLPSSLRTQASDALADRTVAVGSEVVWLEPNASPDELTTLLSNAAKTAIARASRR